MDGQHTWSVHGLLCVLLCIFVVHASPQRCDHDQDGERNTIPFQNALLQVNTRTQHMNESLEEDGSSSSRQPHLLSAAGDASSPLSGGLALIRMPKSGSTTLGFILRALAETNGLQELHSVIDSGSHLLPNTSYLYTQHGQFTHVGSDLNRLLPNAFKISMVRDPAGRCMSAFYHLFEAMHGEAGEFGDREKIAVLTGDCDSLSDGFQFLCQSLSCPGYQSGYLEPYTDATVSEILENYDFIGVTERYEESLVLLAKQLRIDLSDLLYVKTKESGADAECQGNGATNVEKIPLDEESQLVQEAARQLSSDKDARLVDKANLELDRRISEYGPSFESDLAQFRSWLQIADDECRCIGPVQPPKAFLCVQLLAKARHWSLQY